MYVTYPDILMHLTKSTLCNSTSHPPPKKGMTYVTGANFLLHKLLRTPVNNATNKLRQCKQITNLPLTKGHAVAHWLRHCATRRKVALSIHDGVIQNFIDIILPAALSLGVDSASNRMSTRNTSWG